VTALAGASCVKLAKLFALLGERDAAAHPEALQ